MRSGLTWVIYAVCVLLAIDGLAWLTYRAVQAERLRAEARATLIRQQQVQLVLWRMDSALARWLRTEAGRPAEAYLPFSDPDRPEKPSPLLAGAQPPMRLHFAWTPAMGWRSPQVPEGEERSRAESIGIDMGRVAIAERWLAELRERMGPDPRAASLDVSEPMLDIAESENAEFRARRQVAALEPLIDADQVMAMALTPSLDTQLRAIWLESEGREPVLVLLRDALIAGQAGVVGVWVDWSSLRASLSAEVVDLMPNATLTPLTDASAPAIDRLALIPARVNAPAVSNTGGGLGSEAWTAIGVSWAAVLAAVLAVGVVLRQALLLSERRAHFASAVSHELRTPLTSLRLQADLMQSSEPRAGVVREQVQRLESIVESVLAYAGVRRAAQIESILVGELLDAAMPDLRSRVERIGGQLDCQVDDQARAARVYADATLVRRVLDNLIENACAHARSDQPLRIELTSAIDAKWLRMRIADNGPGIPKAMRRRIFRPFVGGQAGGLGLGLALAREAARSMRAKLTLIDASGAVFELAMRRSP